MKKIQILVVDDSAVVRKIMTDIISSQPNMEVCAAAQDPKFAFKHMEKMARCHCSGCRNAKISCCNVVLSIS